LGDAVKFYDRAYPFGWLGILAEAAPSSEALVYTYHERGFALFSMRSQKITRLYFQVPPDEDIRKWSDNRSGKRC
jgi:p-hydroxybenzoate 3-monooxygenase